MTVGDPRPDEMCAADLAVATTSGVASATANVAAAFARAYEVGAGRDGLNLLLWSDRKGARCSSGSTSSEKPLASSSPKP